MDVDFTIQCSPDFTVVLNPGETEIPSNDPRITASLSASIVGDCGTSVEISDNRPDTFQCGTTTPVQFTASGIGNCTTQVTVECTPRHYLAYVEKIFPTISAIKVHHVEEDISTMYDSFGVLQPHQIWVEYDRTGNLLGYVRGEGSQSVKVLNTLTGMSAFPMFAVPAIPVNMAFRPGSIDQHVVVTTMDYQSYEIQLVEASSITSSQTIPSTAGMARPEIAWSPTGDKLSVIYAVRQAGNVNLYIYRWDVVGNVFSNQTLTSVTWPLQLVTKELIHLGDGNLFFGTSFTINYVSGSNINTLYMDSIHDIDFTDDGKAAAYLRKYDLAPGEPVMLVGLIDLDQLGASRLINGPVFVKGRSVALSSDREYVAVGTDEEIFIYTFPDFTLVRRFPANLPHDLVFCSPAFIP